MLSLNWLTEKHLDFEYKRYILLSYLQKVDKEFSHTKLFPVLAQLREHYKSLIELKDRKSKFTDQFPKDLKSINLRDLEMEYESLFSEPEIMKELEAILDYSIPKMEYYVKEGTDILDFVEEKLQLFPIGIEPLYKDEGYLFLKFAERREARIFRYTITLFTNPEDIYREIKTNYVTSYSLNLVNTFEQAKTDLIKYSPDLPNPATYVVESEIKFPLKETFLPVAKKALVKFIFSESRG